MKMSRATSSISAGPIRMSGSPASSGSPAHASPSKSKRNAEDEAPLRASPGALTPGRRSPQPSYAPPPPSPAHLTNAHAGNGPQLVPAIPSIASIQQRHLQLSTFFNGGEVLCLATDRKVPLAARLATGMAAANLMTPASIAPASGIYELVDAPEVTAYGAALGSTGHVSLMDCQLEVFKLHDMPYVGFRSLTAGGRFLQARRRGANRLVFFNSYFGVNEQWGLLDVRVLSAGDPQQHSPSSGSSPRGPAWDALEITMAPRQLPAFELKVIVIRVPPHLRHRAAPRTRSPMAASPVQTSTVRISTTPGPPSPSLVPQKLTFGGGDAAAHIALSAGELSLNPSPAAQDSGTSSGAGSPDEKTAASAATAVSAAAGDERRSPARPSPAVAPHGMASPPKVREEPPGSAGKAQSSATPVQIETERVIDSFVARWQAAAPFTNTQGRAVSLFLSLPTSRIGSLYAFTMPGPWLFLRKKR